MDTLPPLNAFDGDPPAFELLAQQNGVRYWPAHAFMQRLGYESWAASKGVINKAISLCARVGVGVDPIEAFIPMQGTDGQGKVFNSYKLTRFGCLLVTMEADAKKSQVAQAQMAMAAVAAQLIDRYLNANALERLEKREERKLAETLLNGNAQHVGVQSAEYGIFKSAGFRGLYNMSLDALKLHKGAAAHKGTLYDLMGLTEIAANTFRVTQTAERLKNNGVNGLKQASALAFQVGQEVRGVMVRSNGTRPEDLPLEEDINAVKRGIKQTHRELKKIDAVAPKDGRKPS